MTRTMLRRRWRMECRRWRWRRSRSNECGFQSGWIGDEYKCVLIFGKWKRAPRWAPRSFLLARSFPAAPFYFECLLPKRASRPRLRPSPEPNHPQSHRLEPSLYQSRQTRPATSATGCSAERSAYL